MTNHYETLGLKPTATREEIKSAYRKLSVKFHPDNNNGDTYFEALFKNIQEAYETLSDENKKTDYDKKLNPNTMVLDASTTKAINKTPVITYFETDKDSFEEGESIKLSWRTANADKVIIKPFGEVEKTGIKIFKPKNFNKKILSVSLQATNSLFDETVSKTLKIKNLVTEIDFSDLEDAKSENGEPESYKKEQTVSANSFAPTADETALKSNENTESFFSFEGRLRRSGYFLRAILLGIPAAILYALIEETYDSELVLFYGLLVFVLGFLIWMQYVKRLHDINLSGWWSLLNFIPFVGSIFSFIVIFIDSSRGPNKYGLDPKNRG